MIMKNLICCLKKSIDELCLKKDRLIIAIDGRCGSGKTTVADELSKIYDCNTVHMDHFFLRPEQRDAARLAIPGENIDHERFLSKVLIPLRNDGKFSYRPFDCSAGSLGEPIFIFEKKITVIEGTYSCHSSLRDYYDLRIFLSVSPEKQSERILLREGEEKAQIFKSKWIPLEEKYFATLDIEGEFDCVFNL